MTEKILPHIKIVYELSVMGRDSMIGGHEAWEYSLSSEEVAEKKDLRIRLEGNWISVEKFDCRYLRGNADTGEILTPLGEWKTIFIIPKFRVIYIKTENVAFSVNERTDAG